MSEQLSNLHNTDEQDEINLREKAGMNNRCEKEIEEPLT